MITPSDDWHDVKLPAKAFFEEIKSKTSTWLSVKISQFYHKIKLLRRRRTSLWLRVLLCLV